MSNLSRKRRRKELKKKKRIFIIEIIVIVALSVVLFGAIWFAKKMSLITHTELDTSRLYTAEQFNTDKQVQTAAADVTEQQTETAQPQQTEVPQVQSTLSGVDVFALVGLDSRPDEADVKNSDTMMICVINHNDKTIKLCSVYRDTYLNTIYDYYGNRDYYTKANAAYNYGGPEQFLSMLNLNLDLNITEFMTVDFIALAKVVDLLGGLDISMTKQELIHMNNYNVETSEVCGVPYEEIPVPDDPAYEGVIARTFHVNGSQAVSYARIRYTEGYDFKRASRQREVLTLIKEKASHADLGTLDAVLNATLPMVTTNIDNMKLISMIGSVVTYDMSEQNQTGFPFVKTSDDGSLTGEDCVIPITLEHNVTLLHNFLFPWEEYYPSYTVQDYSYTIQQRTGYTDADIEWASQVDELAGTEKLTEEEFAYTVEHMNDGQEVYE